MNGKVDATDYLKNIKSIGIHKAKQFVKKEKFLDELKKHKHAPANYKSPFSEQGMSSSISWSMTLPQSEFKSVKASKDSMSVDSIFSYFFH